MGEQSKMELGNQEELKFGSITEAIIGCAFEVINEMGVGFVESVYEHALAIALQEKGLKVQCQCPIRVVFEIELLVSFSLTSLWKRRLSSNLKLSKPLPRTPGPSDQLLKGFKH